MRARAALAAVLGFVSALAVPSAAQTMEKPDIGEGVRREKERLAGYQWRLRTEMQVDGVVRLLRVDDVHLGPGGELVRKSVRYEKRPAPTPLPENDPRARNAQPTKEGEESRFADQAQDLMQLYARLSPSTLEAWGERAEIQPPDPDRPGLVRLHGRGLGRPQDDAVLYLDAKKKPVEMEIKTTVDPRIVDLAFLRVTFDAVTPRPGVAPLIVPKRIFLNMERARHQVTLEMETSDYRSWP